MAIMMSFMVALLVVMPGGHMGALGSHHSSEQISQSREHDVVKPDPAQAPPSHEHDAEGPSQEKS